MNKKSRRKIIGHDVYQPYGISLPQDIQELIQPWIGYELYSNRYHRKTINVNSKFLPPQLRKINPQTLNRDKRSETKRSQFIVNCVLDFLDVLSQYNKKPFPITNSLAEFIRYCLIFRKFIRFTSLNKYKINKRDTYVNVYLENYLKERGLKIMRDA